MRGTPTDSERSPIYAERDRKHAGREVFASLKILATAYFYRGKETHDLGGAWRRDLRADPRMPHRGTALAASPYSPRGDVRSHFRPINDRSRRIRDPPHRAKKMHNRPLSHHSETRTASARTKDRNRHRRPWPQRVRGARLEPVIDIRQRARREGAEAWRR